MWAGMATDGATDGLDFVLTSVPTSLGGQAGLCAALRGAGRDDLPLAAPLAKRPGLAGPQRATGVIVLCPGPSDNVDKANHVVAAPHFRLLAANVGCIRTWMGSVDCSSCRLGLVGLVGLVLITIDGPGQVTKAAPSGTDAAARNQIKRSAQGWSGASLRCHTKSAKLRYAASLDQFRRSRCFQPRSMASDPGETIGAWVREETSP
jgi:hypothetical protein